MNALANIRGCSVASVVRFIRVMDLSPPAAIVAHQTVSWDRELVPTDAGESAAPTASCPVEVALSAISGRWTTLLLRDLMSGPLAYS